MLVSTPKISGVGVSLKGGHLRGVSFTEPAQNILQRIAQSKGDEMIIQTANQTTNYWCFGQLPEPFYTVTANYSYWNYWVKAPITA